MNSVTYNASDDVLLLFRFTLFEVLIGHFEMVILPS